MSSVKIGLPNSPGMWLLCGEAIEVYPLTPCGGMLCVWQGEVPPGAEAHYGQMWFEDEFVGHVDVGWFDDCVWDPEFRGDLPLPQDWTWSELRG